MLQVVCSITGHVDSSLRAERPLSVDRAALHSEPIATMLASAGVESDWIPTSSPHCRAIAESCNGRARDEFLDEYWCTSLADLQAKAAAWVDDYNSV